MIYQDYEDSIASGIPIELYHIYDSDGNNYRYHTGEDDITYLGYTYSKGIIGRSEIIIGGELNDENVVNIELERGNAFTNDFIASPIDAQAYLNIYRQHVDTYAKIWKGFLTFVKFNENGVPECKFENILTSSIRMGHRRRCSRVCNHALYGGGCGVNQNLYKVEGTITNISGLVITSSQFATQADGYWVGGKINVGNAYRLIKAHAVNEITIDRIFKDASIGDGFIAFAGCDHTPTTCLNKFNNKINFGGNEFLPIDNPFNISVDSFVASAGGSADSKDFIKI